MSPGAARVGHLGTRWPRGTARGERSRGTAWVDWRWRQCQVARCLFGEEGVPAGEVSLAASPRGEGVGA